MNLDELTPAPSAKKVNQLAKRVFGYSLDLNNLSENKAQRLHKNLTEQLRMYEKHLGAAAQTQKKYYEMKLAHEALTKHIAERAVGEADFEEDNAFNTAAAKAKAAGESHFMFNGKKYKVKMDAGTAKSLTDEGSCGSSKKRKYMANDVNESVITEGQVEASELVMAAKSMVDKYDAMIQDVGEMLNEELQPVADKIRDEMGSEVADQFVAQMTAALQNTMDVMKNDRMVADGAARVLIGDTPAQDMGAEPEGDISADELAMEPTVDQEAEVQDEFDAAPASQGGEEAPVGREKRA